MGPAGDFLERSFSHFVPWESQAANPTIVLSSTFSVPGSMGLAASGIHDQWQTGICMFRFLGSWRVSQLCKENKPSHFLNPLNWVYKNVVFHTVTSIKTWADDPWFHNVHPYSDDLYGKCRWIYQSCILWVRVHPETWGRWTWCRYSDPPGVDDSLIHQASYFAVELLLMAEILHQFIGSLSHYLQYIQGFIHPKWWCRISSINSR